VKLIIFYSIIFFTLNSFGKASSSYCKSTKFIYFHNKNKKTIFIDACKIKDFYFSKNCYKKSCSLKKVIFKNINTAFNSVGSPHFSVCHKAGGVPILGKIKNKWVRPFALESISLCFDHKKDQFLSGNYIVYRKFHSK